MTPLHSPPPDLDVFCRVIDNHGDLGVCWRLSQRLARLGRRVRLWLDDARALPAMAPQAARPEGLSVRPWPGDAEPLPEPAPAVIEAFGCTLPDAFQAAMAAQTWRQTAPPDRMHWLNLEYLSAESWVARHHRLPSPVMSGPARGLIKHFFYPGFTPDTGGLMHRDRPEAPSDTNAPPLALDFGVFSYAQPQLGRWMRDWTRCAQAAGLPLRWRLAPGWPQQQVPAQAGRIEHQPFLSQSAFDAALLRPARTWGVNAVRGEDSWVGGLLSGQPVLWQAYPQADGASLDKLEAFLDLYLAQADPEWAQWVRAWHRLWNALPTDAPTEPPAIAPPTLAHLRSWQAHAQSVAQVLRRGPDLAEEILSAMRI